MKKRGRNIGAARLEVGKATQIYLDELHTRVLEAHTSDLPTIALRQHYLPGALALTSSLVRGEGHRIKVESELRAASALLLTRSDFLTTKHDMRQRLRPDFEPGLATWELTLRPEAVRQVERAELPPGFDELWHMMGRLAAQENETQRLAGHVLALALNPQQ